MIDQRTKDRKVVPLGQSLRIGSTGFISSPLIGPLSFVFRHPVATNRCINDGPVFLWTTVPLCLLYPFACLQSP
jgi:hypothetical protein